MLAVIAPGQGSQTPGFLAPWLEIPTFAERLHWLSAVCGLGLAELGTTADAETIKDTAIAQPLIVAAGLVSILELFPHPTDAYRVVGVGAGHSVGEITAAAASNIITGEQAMVFVRERGKAMAAASAATPTGMSAVLGGDPDVVLAKLAEHGLMFLSAPIQRVTGYDTIVPYARMEKIYIPSENQIIETVNKVMEFA